LLRSARLRAGHWSSPDPSLQSSAACRPGTAFRGSPPVALIFEVQTTRCARSAIERGFKLQTARHADILRLGKPMRLCIRLCLRNLFVDSFPERQALDPRGQVRRLPAPDAHRQSEVKFFIHRGRLHRSIQEDRGRASHIDVGSAIIDGKVVAPPAEWATGFSVCKTN
jgi:hypothetical protein